MILNTSAHLHQLWERGCTVLGTDYAIMGGAMSWVSERNLVSALSNAGAFGVLACGSMPPSLLEKEIQATKALTSKPFGVNLILMHPELDALIDVCRAQSVSHVILAGGIPKGSTVEKIKQFARVICFAPSARIAQKLVQMGADALVIEGSEAGGHIGPVSTSVLAQEILPEIRGVPVFVAGGIGRGETIVSYLEMGASGVQLGTRFVCATESIAHYNFKQLFIKSSSRDAVASVQLDPDFPVIPVRAIANKATDLFMRTQAEVIAQVHNGTLDKKAAQLKIEHFWAGALRAAVVDGNIEEGSVMAGQSVGMVQRIQPTQEIIEELLEQACQFLEQKQHYVA
ncbi:MAG: 2-nitropropane dioxygenase [Alphaproteobacteria bacterium]|nr:MAG: 2-nitropropane dioxygenase [Alphaproteobacteria bacterium]TAF41449.1 MAG: 2-nitropropane dioxygenase [Alphaproteobacteria bacterium]TAF75408.1 MAG: 2-nitropropane dioxygenase [Alphaproteobacteria bacterium]